MKRAITLFLLIVLGFQYSIAQEGSKEKMQWWDEAKFGMFIHWGVYSDLAGVWEGEPVRGYAEHILRSKKIPLERYKNEVAANFNPTKFNAEEWVKLCKAAGMKYMVITSKHHDGFAMWDTKVKGWENYDIVDGTKFKRDPMLELKRACDKHGIKFGFYYSHAQDWSHRYGQRNNWDFNHPTSKRPPWYNMPEWKHHIEKSLIYVKEKSIPQLEEILSEKYDPDIIWFDTPAWLPGEYNEMIVKRAREVADPKVIFNSRSAWGMGDYQSTCDKPEEFKPVDARYWEAIPTTNNSYGYHKMDHSHKPASHFIKLLSKAAARGGNLLMNVGPKGDGEIAAVDVEILKGIGDWLKINGDAIYATTKTSLPVQSWGETSIKGNKLYLHIHNYPEEELTLGGLKNKVETVYFLADKSKKKLAANRTKTGDLEVKLPAKKGTEPVTVIVIECADNIENDGSSRLLAAEQANTLHVFDGKLIGKTLIYGKGSDRENYLLNWKDKADFVSWDYRIKGNAKFDVFVVYNSKKGSDKNQFEVTIAGESLKANVVSEAAFKKIYIGSVNLAKGKNTISVKATSISSGELMMLREVVIEPAR